MSSYNIQDVLEKVRASYLPEEKDLVSLLGLTKAGETDALFALADQVRREFVGDGIFLRGIVEFSNVCQKGCFYCGLNKDNRDLGRYTLTHEEIIEAVAHLASFGLKTVVLQSGESAEIDGPWLKTVVEEIKQRFDIAVTLSVGERSYEDYKLWKDAGADRYLLKIETSQKKLYESLHRGASFENRLRCLRDLRSLGYEVGSGNLVGLKGQTLEDLAQDILFFKRENFDMVGIGPFIPHPKSELRGEPAGPALMVLKVLALTRIVAKNVNLPATTALGSLDKDHRSDGLKAGANVLMPNFTPMEMRKHYELYPGKRCLTEPLGSCVGCMEVLAESLGRFIDHSKGNRRIYAEHTA